MSYTSLYRKFRPLSFEDVKGQEHIVKTLKNQIKADRIGHAYLFCGTRGTGKTTIAKILARAVNCEHPVDGSPCNECSVCKSILNQTSMNVIEIDAASNNGVDNIRDIINEVQYSPTEGRYKVYIIDEVHMLSAGAFNALLKTLEEPPSYVIFILATTEVHKIPITILSRCQRYDFHRITIDVIADRMMELMEKEHIEVEEKAIRYVAKAADGSMRDGLSLLDQCIAFYMGEKVTYDNVLEVLGAVDIEVFHTLFSHVLENNVVACLELLEQLVISGRELNQFVIDVTWYLRNVMLIKTSDQAMDMIDLSTENRELMQEMASKMEVEKIMRFIRIFSDLSNQVKYASQKRVLIEVALIKLCRPQMEHDYESLMERLRVIEDKMEQGVVVSTEAAGQYPPKVEIKEAVEVRKIDVDALPEEVKQISGRWHEIVSKINPPLKSMLQQAKLTCGEGNMLVIAFQDETYKAFAEKEEHKSKITDAVEQFLGKKVAIQIKFIDNETGTLDKMPDLSKLIKIDHIEYVK